MLEQLFKSNCNSFDLTNSCITDALAAAGIKFVQNQRCNRRNAFDQARIGTLGIKPKYHGYLWTRKCGDGISHIRNYLPNQENF